MHFVITGNRRGLGLALTTELEQRGHLVNGFSSQAEFPNQVDVSSFASVQEWAKRVLNEQGPPDVLINNAAWVTPLAPLWEQSPEDFSKLVQINILGVHHCIAAFVPAMIARGSGIVINMSSGWGRSTSPRVAPYCATKWAIEGLTKSLAQEFPKGLAAVSLDPGTINTDMLKVAFGNASRHFPDPDRWRVAAADLVLSIHPDQNGAALSVPKIGG
jgi:NAD(P)-dependent dehydrogenase (short-subunit alcohol dehydrogenase family)